MPENEVTDSLRTPKRERERKARRKQMAESQAQQFEDELSGHELNLARLEAIPEPDRDEKHELLMEQSQKAIETLERSIEVSLEMAEG